MIVRTVFDWSWREKKQKDPSSLSHCSLCQKLVEDRGEERMSSYKTSFLILFTLLSSLYQDSLLEMTDEALILERVKLPDNQEILRFSWNNTIAAKTSFQPFSLLQV